MIDKTTSEKGTKGIVLGGAPVKIERIASDLGRSYSAVRRNLDRLEARKYIERIRTPYGFTFRVLNSCKFLVRGKKEIGIFGNSLPSLLERELPKTADRVAKNGGESCNFERNKEDNTNNSATNASDAVAVGSVLGVGPDLPYMELGALDRRHPPSAGTAKSDDDDREKLSNKNLKSPSLTDPVELEQHRIDALKATALRRFKKSHKDKYDPLVATLALDAIEERAKAGGTKIVSAKYFITGLENECTRLEESTPMPSQRALSSANDSFSSQALLDRSVGVAMRFELAASSHPAIADGLRRIAETFKTLISMACDSPGVPDLDALEREINPLEAEVFLLLQTEAADLTNQIRRERELQKLLERYRNKMNAKQLAFIETQFVRKRLLEAFGLPRLSLYYMQMVSESTRVN